MTIQEREEFVKELIHDIGLLEPKGLRLAVDGLARLAKAAREELDRRIMLAECFG